MESGLSLGSNLGDRLANLRAARARIATLPGVRIIAQAPVYETEPVGVQPEHRHLTFLNTVLILETDEDPAELRRRLGAIEAEMGRARSADKFAPRTIDIDLLYMDEERRATAELTLPHPRWAGRRFVVQPLADVRPELRLPGCDMTVRERLAALDDPSGVQLFIAEW
jgi:2-amino-4-hydroxy-6-hydroxymethyldihydropteridine diphosphokinase